MFFIRPHWDRVPRSSSERKFRVKSGSSHLSEHRLASPCITILLFSLQEVSGRWVGKSVAVKPFFKGQLTADKKSVKKRR